MYFPVSSWVPSSKAILLSRFSTIFFWLSTLACKDSHEASWLLYAASAAPDAFLASSKSASAWDFSVCFSVRLLFADSKSFLAFSTAALAASLSNTLFSSSTFWAWRLFLVVVKESFSLFLFEISDSTVAWESKYWDFKVFCSASCSESSPIFLAEVYPVADSSIFAAIKSLTDKIFLAKILLI